MISIVPHKGHLLVAEPTVLNDNTFNRSVILLAEHDKNGSVGFILNKPLSFNLNDLVPEIKIPLKVFNGGPLEQDNLFFLHNIPTTIPGSVEIADGIFWGGDFETAKNLINNGTITRKNIRFFLGYSGWNKKQLDQELQENSWLIVKNNLKSKILSKSANHFWKEKIIEQGGSYILFSNAPENPNLN